MSKESEILNFLKGLGVLFPNENCLEFNYFESEFFDSIKIASLVVFLEDTYGVEFSEEDFMSPKFGSVNGLVALVEAAQS